MNPISLLLSPAGRIPASQFWLGVALMVIVAFAFAFAANAGLGFLVPVGFLLLWPYFAVFAKRFRDKGNSPWLTLVPLLVAGIGWIVTAFVFLTIATFDLLPMYAETQGIPEGTNLAEELANNPEFNAGFQAFSQTPEGSAALMEALGARSGQLVLWATAVFWAISALIGLWPGTGGSKPEGGEGASV